MKFWECQKKVNLSANYVQIKKELRNNYRNSLFLSSSSWARTKDPLINSQML